ncbi:hypothetical protein DRH29_02855 [candidate division Kazan bacterium]|uniref:Uncharacterized protein n=1 Tax=candidate division Kazan bacterium TaxID=2202143 RepID=A0A420ZCL6_UNCK3|nr:MAG: hypothetical protein DRH29_02855 [candidate division Kazan bacterium]
MPTEQVRVWEVVGRYPLTRDLLVLVQVDLQLCPPPSLVPWLGNWLEDDNVRDRVSGAEVRVYTVYTRGYHCGIGLYKAPPRPKN